MTSKPRGPLMNGGITDTIKKVPISHEKTKDPVLFHHNVQHDQVPKCKGFLGV